MQCFGVCPLKCEQLSSQTPLSFEFGCPTYLLHMKNSLTLTLYCMARCQNNLFPLHYCFLYPTITNYIPTIIRKDSNIFHHCTLHHYCFRYCHYHVVIVEEEEERKCYKGRRKGENEEKKNSFWNFFGNIFYVF